MRRLAAILLGAVLLTGCGVSLSSGGQQGFVSGDGSFVIFPADDRDDPVDVSGDLVGGGTAHLADFRGKVVVMPIWGSWCGPCRKEAPMLEAQWRALSEQGVQFLGINVRDGDKAQRAAFIRNNDITYPSFDNNDGSLLLDMGTGLGPKTVPGVVFLDAQGRVAAVVRGEITRTTLANIVEEISA